MLVFSFLVSMWQSYSELKYFAAFTETEAFGYWQNTINTSNSH